MHLQGPQAFVQIFYVGWTTDYMKECEIYSRAKDKGSATADWFSELLSPNPWFKDVVPNVSIHAESVITRLINSVQVPDTS